MQQMGGCHRQTNQSGNGHRLCTDVQQWNGFIVGPAIQTVYYVFGKISILYNQLTEHRFWSKDEYYFD